ncbi:MAG: DUF861 domain-containing protein [Rhizobiaceae bacterium]|nr:DUF861 domain-containing protein [Rhizobiaceae bacterium]
MVTLQHFEPAAEIALGQALPKASSIEGNQHEAEAVLWTSPDGRTEIGVWECSPGRFHSTRDGFSETCYILSGRLTLTESGRSPVFINPGEMIVLPTGWQGEWWLHDTVRKIYVVTRD